MICAKQKSPASMASRRKNKSLIASNRSAIRSSPRTRAPAARTRGADPRRWEEGACDAGPGEAGDSEAVGVAVAFGGAKGSFCAMTKEAAAAAGGTVGAVCSAAWRGNATVSEARQSFHSRVAMGGEVALPSNGLSKTAKLTSFPAGTLASEVRIRSSWLRNNASAAASVVPNGARYTYSRYVSGRACVRSCSRLKTIFEAVGGCDGCGGCTGCDGCGCSGGSGCGCDGLGTAAGGRKLPELP